MNNFRELKVWEKARSFTKEMYYLLKKYPADEKFALVSQMKRATISISSNIAEGSGRYTNNDFARFLDIALGSCYEIETQYVLSMDLGFVTEIECDDIIKDIVEIERMIIGLINSKRKR